MRYQKESYSCGAAAVANATRCFGKKISERSIIAMAETTTDGTDEFGIIKALDTLGFKAEKFELNDSDVAIKRLINSVTIICIQNLQHWVTVIASVDNDERFIIVDPANTQRNIKENGIHTFSRKELLKLWQTREGNFFGITVLKPRKRQ